MLNYANLNDVEFEYLCQDIMSKKLGVELRRFAQGRDGGIDLTDVVTKNIVVQVKHYSKTDINGLINSLKKEVQKVQKLKPKQYYICCSKELTQVNINAIYELFKNYMDSEKNIITLLEIEDFLVDSKNTDILRKHYKLWISSTNIFNDIFSNDIHIDSSILLDETEKQVKYFVQTKAYDEALKCLEKNRTLFLVGDPGVGKTVTSKMLVLHFVALGYRIRYTTDVTDINNMKKSITSDRDVKEIILLDDCLGQAYFNMRESQENELLQLIKYVNYSEQKVLILNSRVTIFEEAKNRTPKFVDSFQNNEFKVHIINMQQVSNLEKAKILYNHLFFNKISNEYFEVIKKDKLYNRIIEHSNYNPRVIEFITSPNQTNDIEASSYSQFIINCLNNPREIWANEYDRRLSYEDRILLLTLYSLTETTENYDYVETIYNEKIKNIPNIDKTLNNFELSLGRLQSSFVKIIDEKESKKLSVINPSINDFLNGKFKEGKSEQGEIIKESKSIHQLIRLLPTDELNSKVNEIMLNGSIEEYIFRNQKEKDEIISYYLLKNKIKNANYNQYLDKFLNNFNAIRLTESHIILESTLFYLLLNNDIITFYNLDKHFLEWENVYNILKKLDFFSLTEAIFEIDLILEFDDEWCIHCEDFLIDEFQDYFSSVYADEFIDDLEDFLSHNSSYSEFIKTTRADYYIDTFIADGTDFLNNLLNELLDEQLDKLPSKFNITKIKSSTTIEIYDISSAVESLVINEYDDYGEDEFRESYSKEPNEIEMIFER